MATLSDLDIQQAEARLETKLSPSTVHVAHGVLATAMKAAMRWQYLTTNPMAELKAPREGHYGIRTLSEAETMRLISDTSNDRYHALWVLLVTSRLRLREALGLTWADVDLDACRLIVQAQLPRRKADGEKLIATKTRMSRRTVIVPEDTVDALRMLKTRQEAEKRAIGGAWKAKKPLLFTTSTGAPMYGSRAYSSWQTTKKRLGLADIRIHDLRHTCATLLLQRGVHVKLVSELLGHSDISMTLRVYGHVIPAMHGDAARQIQTLFGSVVVNSESKAPNGVRK